MRRACGFTIVEILVASTLFVSLVGVTAFAFQRLSEGGRYAQRVIALHEKADSILRMMEEDMRLLQQTCAIQIQKTTVPYSFTFARTITNQQERMQHVGDTKSSITGIGAEEEQRADIIWARWEWGEGDLRKGMSRFKTPGRLNMSFVDETKDALKSVSFGTPNRGMHANGIPPVPHQHFVNFWGNGTFKTVASDGSVSAISGDQIRVYQRIDPSAFNGNICQYFDAEDSPWRVNHDYSHWYTTYLVGNYEILSDQAFAVCNADGKTFNKDRINLLGAPDETGGDYFYPSQMSPLFGGVEYMNVELVKKNGQVLNASDDDDTIADGNASIDVSGIDTAGLGFNIDKRPVSVRVSFLIHSIDLDDVDESDYDVDDNSSETLVQAIRDQVESESHVTREEQIKAFTKHAEVLGASVLYVQYSIKLSL